MLLFNQHLEVRCFTDEAQINCSRDKMFVSVNIYLMLNKKKLAFTYKFYMEAYKKHGKMLLGGHKNAVHQRLSVQNGCQIKIARLHDCRPE